MPKIKFEKIIKANRDKVFSIISDYENFEKTLPQYFPSVRVRSARDDTAVVEQHLRIAGRELVMMTKHVTKHPDLHEVFVIGGDAKGSHIVERYEQTTDGTKLTVDADLKLTGVLRLGGLFGKSKIKDSLSSIMDEFATIAEG